MTAIFADLKRLTHTHAHTVEASTVPVFGHVQVVGFGMAQSLSLWMKPRAAHRVFQLHPPAQIGPSSPVQAMVEAGCAGLSCWSCWSSWLGRSQPGRASQAEPASHTIPVLAEPVLHLIITCSYRKWWATCSCEGRECMRVCLCVYLHPSMCLFFCFFKIRLLPTVIICKSWHLLSTHYALCVCMCVCAHAFWLDPTVWQRWEDEDWSPKNTPGLGWLAETERDRNRRGGLYSKEI